MIVPAELKALIIDDNGYARTAVAATLRKLGLVSIDEHAGAAAAVGAMLGTRYDVVFMDWYMPEMNGAGRRLGWPLQKLGLAPGNLGFRLAGAFGDRAGFSFAGRPDTKRHGEARGVHHPDLQAPS